MVSKAKKTTGQTTGIEIPEIIRLLTSSYGPFPQEPRLDPAHELTFTILSSIPPTSIQSGPFKA